MATIISAFATCGKSILGKKYKNVLDLESSTRNKDIARIPLVENYIQTSKINDIN